jgi:type II restriction/modification system DNA methylase subunit YeeA
MISDKIKQRFVSKLLDKEAKAIAAEQAKVVEEWNLFSSRALYNLLINQQQGHFSIDNAEGGHKLTVRYLKYLRFLDIPKIRKRREQYHLYNEIVFGHLYRPLLQGLRFGYTGEVRQAINEELSKLGTIETKS